VCAGIDESALILTAALPYEAGLAIVCLALAAGVLAAMALRWLDSTVAVWAMLPLGTGWLLVQPSSSGALLSVVVLTGIAAFAWANCFGRASLCRHPLASLLFYASMAVALAIDGFVGLTMIAAPCLAAAALGSDARAGRFLFRPVGWLLVGSALLFAPLRATAASPDVGHALAALGDCLFPWWLVAIGAAVGGIRLGHYATPFWRLCGCWLAAPMVLALVGAAPVPTCAAAMLPPLALTAGSGLRWARARVEAAAWRRAPQTEHSVAFVRVRSDRSIAVRNGHLESSSSTASSMSLGTMASPRGSVCRNAPSRS
jgi:hypothetical protein